MWGEKDKNILHSHVQFNIDKLQKYSDNTYSFQMA